MDGYLMYRYACMVKRTTLGKMAAQFGRSPAAIRRTLTSPRPDDQLASQLIRFTKEALEGRFVFPTGWETTADEAKLKSALGRFLKARELSQASVAREIHISKQRLSQWLAGTYKGKSKPIAERVRNYIARHPELTNAI